MQGTLGVFELSLVCPQQRVETVSDALDALDARSVSVEDANALTALERPLFGEPGMEPSQIGWGHSRISALFGTEAQARDAAALLAAQDFFADCQMGAIVEVPEQDWVRETQAQFAPVSITPDFWIVPSWHAPPAEARQVIRLDPGLAFGTGTHPTTRMCLQWIANRAKTSPLGRVLDYGCGSGILAIAAAMHGAASVDAVDIDPAAVETSRFNSQANDVALHCGLPDAALGQYQTVFANILATPLKVLAPLLCARLLPAGNLVLAGILERQADELTEAYAPHVRLSVAMEVEGWVLMTAANRGGSEPTTTIESQ